MKKTERRSTSASGTEKLNRARRQLANVTGLVRSLPNYIWESKKQELGKILEQIEEIEKQLNHLSKEIN